MRKCKARRNKFNEIVHLILFKSYFIYFSRLILLERQPVFEGHGLEQHWRPLWLSLELIMPLKNKAPKPPTDRAEPPRATTAVTAEIATLNGAVAAAAAAASVEPPVPQPKGDDLIPRVVETRRPRV